MSNKINRKELLALKQDYEKSLEELRSVDKYYKLDVQKELESNIKFLEAKLLEK